MDHKISLSIVDRREVVMSSIRLLAFVLLNISADHDVAVASEFADSKLKYSFLSFTYHFPL